MYINQDTGAGTAIDAGIGGPTGQRIITRHSIIALWEKARAALEHAGAEVIVVDFPTVTNYEGDRPNAPKIGTRGLIPAHFLHHEITDLSVWGWDDFLKANGDRNIPDLAAVDGAQIFPTPHGSLPDRYFGFDDDIADYPAHARAHPTEGYRDIPTLADGLRGLEETRHLDLEDWMDERGLNAVIFPAVADVGPADADTNPASADKAWRNGVWVANGNLAIRHLGIPTVTVPMGMMEDIHMPAGLTFAGRAYSDNDLLAMAAAFERTGSYRSPPNFT
jgi:amidase